MKKRNLQKIMATLALILSPLGLPAPAGAAECDDVEFIFARGSGASLGEGNEEAWRTSLEAELRHSDFKKLKYSFYELGTREQGGYIYPAIPVSDSLTGYINLFGTFFTKGSWSAFSDSVAAGRAELGNYIAAVSAPCPKTQFVLGGYSQGALVMSSALPYLDAGKILYAATFGDPKLYLPEGETSLFHPVPDACLGEKISDYRADVPDCYAFEGILGSLRPYAPPEFYGKVGAWCNDKDIMCSSGMNLDDHLSYTTDNLYAAAAGVIADRLRDAFPKTSSKPDHSDAPDTSDSSDSSDSPDEPNHPGDLENPSATETPTSPDTPQSSDPKEEAPREIAIVLDYTYSMLARHSYLAPRLKAFASAVAEQGGRTALVSYNDIYEYGYTKVNCTFACSPADFEAAFDKISYFGGGASPAESALSGLRTALEQLDWSENSRRTILLVTDGTFYNPERDAYATTPSDIVALSLEKDIQVSAYVVEEYLEDFRSLVERCHGNLYNYTSTKFEEVQHDLLRSLDQNTALPDAAPAQASQNLSAASVATTSARATSTLKAAIQVSRPQALLATSSVFASSDPAVTALFAERSGSDLVVHFATEHATHAFLVVNDAPLGLAELSSPSGSFTLKDAPGDITIRLIPYRDGHRAAARTLTIPAQTPPTTPIPTQTPSQTLTPKPQKPVPTTPLPTKTPAQGQPLDIPDAPNAGCLVRRS